MAHFSLSHAEGNARKPTLVELRVGINRPGYISQCQQFAAFFFDHDRLLADLEKRAFKTRELFQDALRQVCTHTLERGAHLPGQFTQCKDLFV
jgi:hypothetical protein